jgi:hypothetical protein
MAYEVVAGPQSNIVILRLTGDLTHEDMTCDEALGFNAGRPMYLLLDASAMHVGLPDNFLNGAKNSFFVNDSLVHMALYLESQVLRTVALMVAKVTRRQEKMSLHSSYDAALNHLLNLAAKQDAKK